MSRAEAAALLKLAESIADGEAIDWAAAEAGAGQDDKAVIRQLRILSNLAGLHRTLASNDSTAGRTGAPLRRDGPRPAIGQWAHLTLLERLGGGTFGEVYRAWDRHLEREVALKLLRVDEAGENLADSRIAQEGRLLARIRHQNVITVHGVDADDNRVGLWMELVRGATLEQQLAAHGSFSATEAAAIGVDLCRALAAIHAAGLIHRDVKAQNVMREDGGRIVLMDLGTGREADRFVARGVPELAGTPLYLAPEIFAGSPASQRTDLYSLGVLLYRLVTGSFPVRATTIDALQMAHARGEFVRLRDARADLPTGFVQVIDRAIAPEPLKRYATAGEFEADLADALRRPEAKPGGGGARAFWKSPAFAFLAVAAGLLMAAWPRLGPRPPAAKLSFGANDMVLVGDVANRTGEAIFDGALREALTVELQQSPFFNAAAAKATDLPRTAPGQGDASSAAARDVCARLRMKALVSGSIARTAGEYDVVLQARDCPSGNVIAEAHSAAPKPAVLRALGVATAALREQLGEPRASIQQFNVPAEEATTASLDALKAYSAGMEARAKSGDAAAIPFFNHAVELDPQFALAEGRLASIYANLHEFEQSKAHTEKAYALSDKVTERERLYLRASYHLHVTGNLDEASGAYRLWMRLYPQDWLPHSNFGALQARVGHYEESLTELSAGRTLGPDQQLTYVQLAQTYTAMGRFADANATIAAASGRGLDTPTLRALRVTLAFIEGGPAASRAELALPANAGKDYPVLAAAARVEAAGGGFAEARSLVAQAVAKATAARVPDFAAGLIAEDALDAALVGDTRYARTVVDRALATSRGSDTLWAASLANAFAGRRPAAESLAADYLRSTPPTIDVVAVFGPVLKAAVALNAGNPSGAVEALQPSIPYERIGRLWPAYLRGLAYQRMKQPRLAANEFQTMLTRRGDDPTSLLLPLAELQAGRALVSAGDVNGARAAFDAFITHWQQAGGSQPLYTAAVRERGRLPK